MANDLVKRTSRRAMSTANRDRVLARIERELKATISASPLVRNAIDQGHTNTALALVESTMQLYVANAMQNIRLLWP